MVKRNHLICGLLTLSVGVNAYSEDTKVSSDPKPTRPNYQTVGDVVGEIVKLDNPGQGTGSMTVRVTWYTTTPPKGSRNHNGNWVRGSVSRNPQQMMQHQMQMQKQMSGSAGNPKKNTADYTFDFAVDAVARIKHLPPKLDENGKRTVYEGAEWQKLKGNPNIPGYTVDLSMLKVGQIVEAHTVRLPSEKEKKNLYVRWALILNDEQVKDTNKSESAKKK